MRRGVSSHDENVLASPQSLNSYELSGKRHSISELFSIPKGIPTPSISVSGSTRVTIRIHCDALVTLENGGGINFQVSQCTQWIQSDAECIYISPSDANRVYDYVAKLKRHSSCTPDSVIEASNRSVTKYVKI